MIVYSFWMRYTVQNSYLKAPLQVGIFVMGYVYQNSRAGIP